MARWHGGRCHKPHLPLIGLRFLWRDNIPFHRIPFFKWATERTQTAIASMVEHIGQWSKQMNVGWATFTSSSKRSRVYDRHCPVKGISVTIAMRLGIQSLPRIGYQPDVPIQFQTDIFILNRADIFVRERAQNAEDCARQALNIRKPHRRLSKCFLSQETTGQSHRPRCSLCASQGHLISMTYHTSYTS